MRVLMFGWEYPPHISGGLGTACFGLTTALTKKGVDILFVVPKLFGDEYVSGARLLSAEQVSNTLARMDVSRIESVLSDLCNRISYVEIDSLLVPYMGQKDYYGILESRKKKIESEKKKTESRSVKTDSENETGDFKYSFSGGYGENLFEEVERYALVAGSVAKQNDFDVIHSHDWLTYKAGIVSKQISGKPLIVHVHATEYDRSGENINRQVYQIEKQGMDFADRIIAVSEFTRDILIRKYGQPPHKVITVHNGVDSAYRDVQRVFNPFDKKIVSFIGRITFQKGPDYFVEAADMVLKKDRNFVFVMAGKGDMMNRMIALVARKRISENFFFAGFLLQQEVSRLLAMSDMYVMPSVSEPFGISPLEAMQASTPAIISKQSGVSEILRNVIKVDFWDIEAMADAIYAIGNHDVLRQRLSRKAKEEVAGISWDSAADKIREIYFQLK